jgi:hypothetical protein
MRQIGRHTDRPQEGEQARFFRSCNRLTEGQTLLKTRAIVVPTKKNLN